MNHCFSILAPCLLVVCLLLSVTGCTPATFFEKRNEARVAQYESNLPKALRLATEAAETAQKDQARNPDDVKARLSLMLACLLRGDVLEDMGQFDKAAACYDSGLQFAQKFCSDKSSPERELTMKAVFLMKKGGIYVEREEAKKAIGCLTEAKNIFAKIAAEKKNENIGEGGHVALGYAYLLEKRPDKAMPLFRKNLDNKEGLAKKYVYSPGGGKENNWEYVNARSDVAEAYNKLGDCWMFKKQPCKAVSCYEKGLELNRFMDDVDPANGVPRAALEDSYGGLGEAYLEMKQPSKALNAFEERLKISQYLHDGKLTWETITQYDLAVALWDLGRGYMAMKDREKARAAFEKSLAISRRLHRKYPEKWKFRKIAERSARELEEELGRN